jgi:hypothetical protein
MPRTYCHSSAGYTNDSVKARVEVRSKPDPIRTSGHCTSRNCHSTLVGCHGCGHADFDEDDVDDDDEQRS